MLKSLTPLKLIDADPSVFTQSYGNVAFEFAHRLAGHPLFELDRLLELAEAMQLIPNGITYNTTSMGVGERLDQTPKPEQSVVETLRDIEHVDGWILLKRADHFPEYRELLEICLDEMEEASGRNLKGLVKYRNCSIFINSPNRITNYHIDREWNALLQIRGTKRISVFDRTDREVLTEDEIERFWTVDNGAAKWKSQFENRARVFELTPGSALHIPINSPHWVQNGPEFSVSMSANFHIHDELLGYVYRTNYWLRRVGLRPAPPGRSAWRDAIKGRGYASLRSVGNRLRGRTL